MLHDVTTPYNITILKNFMSKKLDIEEVSEMDDEATTERMYFLTKSLKRDSRFLGTAIIAFVILVGLMILFTYSFYDDMAIFGTLTELYGEDCISTSPEDHLSQEVVCYTFEPHSGTVPAEVVSLMYQSRDAMNFWMWVWLIGLGAPLIFTYAKLRSKNNEMRDVADDYIRDSYFLNLELANPQGRDKAEKIFNLLKTVFPEVRLLAEREVHGTVIPRLPNKFKEIDVSGYKFALKLDTKDGKIGVMFFDKLTYEELKKFTKKVSSEFKEVDDRIICIAKEFGDEFHPEENVTEDDAEWDEQEKRMDELSVEGHVDLIKEDKTGYSIMWID